VASAAAAPVFHGRTRVHGLANTVRGHLHAKRSPADATKRETRARGEGETERQGSAMCERMRLHSRKLYEFVHPARIARAKQNCRLAKVAVTFFLEQHYGVLLMTISFR